MSILKTLAYYDTFDWPLTSFEAWKYLSKLEIRDEKLEIRLSDIVRELASDGMRKYVVQKSGFYFLKDREGDNLAEKRIEAEKLADMKWRILKRRAKWIMLVPYVRGVMVSGSMAIGNVNDGSDFDLLVVTKKGRIWTSRLLLTLLLEVLGWRRKADKTKNRICLNHYVTEHSLRLNLPSLYNAQTYAHLVQILGHGDLIDSFRNSNPWVADFLYLWDSEGTATSMPSKAEQRVSAVPRVISAARSLFELFLSNGPGDLLERWVSLLQIRKISRNPKTRERGGRVAVSDLALEFHPDSKEKVVLDRFNRRIAGLGFPGLATERDSGLI